MTVFPSSGADLIRQDEPFVAGRFWKNHESTDCLAVELLRSNAPLVHIQYTEGFFRTEDMVALLQSLQGKKKVVITCHNSAFLCPSSKMERDILNSAFYVVHQDRDLLQLQRNGILPERIFHIALGQVSFDIVKKEDARNALGIYNADLVLGSYGFLLPHKGILETIEAIAELKADYPHILYIACCSLYNASVSQEYYDRCCQEIAHLGLDNNVILIPDFLPAKESAFILQACDMLVMAYGDTQESASGAVRFCIAAERPLITTTQNIFNEYKDCSLQIPNNRPATIAAGVKQAIMDGENHHRMEKMHQRAEATSWKMVSKKYFELYRRALEE